LSGIAHSRRRRHDSSPLHSVLGRRLPLARHSPWTTIGCEVADPAIILARLAQRQRSKKTAMRNNAARRVRCAVRLTSVYDDTWGRGFRVSLSTP